MNNRTKTCSKCKIEKDIDEFYFYQKSENRRRGTCKDCEKPVDKKRSRIYYQKNNERVNKQSQIYKQNNLEKVKKWMRIYRQKNREKEKKRCRIYRQNNPEKVKKWMRNWQEKNPDYFQQPHIKIQHNLRRSLLRFLKGEGKNPKQ